LLKALVLACGLYGGLACMSMVVGIPGTRLTERTYGDIRISLGPAVREDLARTTESVPSPEPASPFPEVLRFEDSAAAETAQGEISVSGEASGEAVGTGGEAIEPGPTALQGQPEAAADATAWFVAWLEAEIRERLVYPDRARRRNIEGVVTVGLTVPADGSSCVAVVTGGSGSTLLDRAAVDLVRSLFPAGISPGNEFADSIQIAYRLVRD